MQVEFTRDPGKMIEFAKAIVAEKSKYYTPQTLESIKDQVRMRAGKCGEQEIDDKMYITIYYYWFYGCAVDEYFYYRFYEKTYDEIKSYITKREKVHYTNWLNRIEDAHFLQNKFETYQLFKEDFKREMIYCDSEENYGEFLSFVRRHPVFVVKALQLGGGQGVFKDSVIGLTEDEILNKYREFLAQNDILNSQHNSWGGKSAFVVEELIDAGEEIAKLHPQSVNVVRMPTFNLNGTIMVFQPWIKIGRGDSFIDNGHADGLMAGIDPETGIIDTPGYSEFPESFEYHPDTGIKIPGFAIPNWNELVETVKRLSAVLPTIKYISWDMAWTKKGWAIMEGNFRGAFMWQFFRQKGMKKEIEELIDWKLPDGFWWQINISREDN